MARETQARIQPEVTPAPQSEVKLSNFEEYIAHKGGMSEAFVYVENEAINELETYIVTIQTRRNDLWRLSEAYIKHPDDDLAYRRYVVAYQDLEKMTNGMKLHDLITQTEQEVSKLHKVENPSNEIQVEIKKGEYILDQVRHIQEHKASFTVPMRPEEARAVLEPVDTGDLPLRGNTPIQLAETNHPNSLEQTIEVPTDDVNLLANITRPDSSLKTRPTKTSTPHNSREIPLGRL